MATGVVMGHGQAFDVDEVGSGGPSLGQRVGRYGTGARSDADGDRLGCQMTS
jgi:hypothetical protein